MSDKSTGSFYTPESLIKYMADFAIARVRPHSILEPSAGDGRFVNYLDSFSCPITLIEFDEEKASHLEKQYGEKCGIVFQDYLAYSLCADRKYDLIIGNPPYIKKASVPDDRQENSYELIKLFDLDASVFQNIWVSFILGSIKMLSETGSIFFVLPYEFLQVQYAKKLRNFLEERFNAIEIVTFQERIFTQIEQDICLVYLSNTASSEPYILYRTLISDSNPTQVFQSIIKRNKPLDKWSNCILNDTETERLTNIAAQCPKVSDFGDIAPGIVTGANSFFTLSSSKMEELQIPSNHQLPILINSSSVPQLLLYKKQDFDLLSKTNANAHLLWLSGWEYNQFPPSLKSYLKSGEDKEIHNKYKCAHRKPWYDVPITKKGDVCFFRRFDFLPKIIVNECSIHTTDVAYNIRLKDQYDAPSFAFCFYNSLTLALCEYTGRFYGGGVGELTPSEFKALHIPYRKVNKENIQTLDKMIRDRESPIDIINYVDSIVLNKLPKKDANLLKDIRNRYIKRRQKKISD